MNKKTKIFITLALLAVFAVFLTDASNANRKPIPVDVCKVANKIVKCKSKKDDAIEYAYLLKAKNQAFANCLPLKSVSKRKACNQQVNNVFNPILANFKG